MESISDACMCVFVCVCIDTIYTTDVLLFQTHQTTKDNWYKARTILCPRSLYSRSIL